MRDIFLKLVLAATLFAGLVSTGGLVYAADCTPTTTQEAIQCGTDNASGAPKGATPGSLNTTIGNVINLISAVVGVAAVIMLILGGFRYITSSGNQEAVKAAKNTIMYALIGLVIVALAQVIVNFVLDKATQPASTSSSSSGANQSPH